MPTGSDLAWLLASGAFTLTVTLLLHYVMRDRSLLQEQLDELSRGLEGMGRSMDRLREEIQRLTVDHERRIVRLETILDGPFGHKQQNEVP